jgi:hemoglobin
MSIVIAIGTRLAAVFLILIMAACASTADRSLYGRLGGTAGLEAIVDGMLLRMAGDERINHFFVSTDIVRFRKLLVEQFCDEIDGPCDYSGFPMEEAHANRHVTEAHFNAVVEHLTDSMEELDISVTDQNRLIASLAPLRGQIIRR